MTTLTKKCLVCGKEFTKPVECSRTEWFGGKGTRRFLGRRYCSKSCAKVGKPSWNKGKKTGLVPRTAFKKGEFRHPETAFKKGLLPWNKGKKGVMPEPWNKGREWKEIQGKNHWNWKGGTTLLRVAIRQLHKYKQWRTAVFHRDNWTCVHCGARSKKGRKVILHADHINPFYKILKDYKIKTVKQAKKCKELWDIRNGRTLCIPCHKQTPSYLVNQYTID